MSIFRIRKDKDNPYVMINKEIFNNENLSWKAKGLLCHLLSLPDDWKIFETDLVERSTDGKDSVKSAIKELMQEGYIKRERIRNSDGRLGAYDYCVYEKPNQDGKSNLDQSGKSAINQSGKSAINQSGKSATTNNNNINNNNINNNKEIEEVVSKYNSISELSNIVKVTDKRKKALNARIKNTSIEDVFKVLDIVATSDFLKGNNNRNWKCDFDWIMNPNNFVKVLEGRYGTIKEVKKETHKPQQKASESFVSNDMFNIDIDY